MTWYCQSCHRYQQGTGHYLKPDGYSIVRHVCGECVKPSEYVAELPRVILHFNRRNETVVNGRVKPHLGCE